MQQVFDRKEETVPLEQEIERLPMDLDKDPENDDTRDGELEPGRPVILQRGETIDLPSARYRYRAELLYGPAKVVPTVMDIHQNRLFVARSRNISGAILRRVG